MSILNKITAEQSPLGKSSHYDTCYNADLLFSIPRKNNREQLNITSHALPFFGFDLWNHYEVSWLNEKGKPMVAIVKIIYDCHSPNIIESKSMKLYFNSFNNTKFKDAQSLKAIIENDIEKRIGAKVNVTMLPLSHPLTMQNQFTGICIDDLDVACSTYTIDANFLTTENNVTEETLYSDLLKSNCLVTHQPDWASVQIAYKGKQINRVGLLQYIVSFRNHNEFHEQCIERIFVDIMRRCQPQTLTVYGRYTRRGGIDINPYRSTQKDWVGENIRLGRQ